MKEQREYYRRHLPHYQPIEAEYHVVFRLAGSIPAKVINELREERETEQKCAGTLGNKGRRQEPWYKMNARYMAKIEGLLDNPSAGPRWLADHRIAEIVAEAIHYRDHRKYDLYAFTIMSNHVHMVFATVCRAGCPTDSVTDILQKLKWNTALKANRLLHRSGAFWQGESYDHVIRTDDELVRTIEYVLNNPVKAGLVRSWKEWPWTYWKELPQINFCERSADDGQAISSVPSPS